MTFINDDATDCITFETLFTIDAMLLEEESFFGLGKLNNFNISC